MKNIFLLISFSVSLIGCKKSAMPQSSALPAATQTEEIAQDLREKELEEEKLRHEIEMEKLAMERDRLQLEKAELAARQKMVEDGAANLQEDQKKFQEDQLAAANEKANDAEARAQEAEARQREMISSGTNTVSAVNDVGDYDYSIFYDRLSPYGSWINHSAYGYIWQPSVYVSNRSWRPYNDGYWRHTNRGWLWISNEPFGWATFHYGRWALLRNVGWCWIPGNEWAPSWVSWRNNNSYIGWAPLPPETLYWRGNQWDSDYDNVTGINSSCYTYVAYQHFSNSNLNQFCLTSNLSAGLYPQTQRCGRMVWKNYQVSCQSLPFDTICKYMGKQMTTYDCDFQARPPLRNNHNPYATVRDQTIEIIAPNFRNAWNAVIRPKQLDERIVNNDVIREREPNRDVMTRFRQDRQNDLKQAERSVKSPLAQKMMKRISLNDQISQRREDLLTSMDRTRAVPNRAERVRKEAEIQREPIPTPTEKMPEARAQAASTRQNNPRQVALARQANEAEQTRIREQQRREQISQQIQQRQLAEKQQQEQLQRNAEMAEQQRMQTENQNLAMRNRAQENLRSRNEMIRQEQEQKLAQEAQETEQQRQSEIMQRQRQQAERQAQQSRAADMEQAQRQQVANQERMAMQRQQQMAEQRQEQAAARQAEQATRQEQVMRQQQMEAQRQQQAAARQAEQQARQQQAEMQRQQAQAARQQEARQQAARQQETESRRQQDQLQRQQRETERKDRESKQ